MGKILPDQIAKVSGMDAVTIALVRHGETDWNKAGRYQGSSDIELNDLGRAQALEAVPFLQQHEPKQGWHHLRYSPLHRAAETASIIARALNISRMRTLPSLVERDWGAAEGLTLDEINQKWPELGEKDEMAMRSEFPGVEPKQLTVARGLYALENLTVTKPGHGIICASHGSLIRLTLDALLETKTGRIPNAGTTIVRTWIDGAQLRGELVSRNF